MPSRSPGSSRRRRRLLVSLTALPLVLSVAAVVPYAGASPGTADDAAIPLVPARAAEEVVDAYGIGIHSSYWDTPYGDTARVVAALTDLGVEHVRDDLWNNTPESYVAINQIAAAGIGFDLIMGNPSRGQAPAEYVATVEQHLLGAVESIEGPNEWDNFGPGGWADELRSFQAGLYAAAKARPATAGLPVLAPALAFRSNYSRLGTQTGVADVANSHLYSGGREPSVDIAAALAETQARSGTTSTIVTEAGYHNALATTGGHHPVPEDLAAAYLPRLLAEHALAGTERVYSYELIDEVADPDRTDPEANFGLLRHDWSPKPAYTAMKRLLALLDDTEEAFTPGELGYTTSGGGSDLRQLLTQRSDGTFVLLLWRDVSLWSTGQRTRIPVAPTSVTISLADSLTYAVHQPRSVLPLPTQVGVGRSITLPLAGDLVAVTLSAPDPSLPDLPLPDLPLPDLPEVPVVTDVVDLLTRGIGVVTAAPRVRGAKVSWTAEGATAPGAGVVAEPTEWRIKVFRGRTKVRSVTRVGPRSSVSIRRLSPRHRYRIAVVARAQDARPAAPARSGWVRPAPRREQAATRS
ncbi:hypothetical protein [Nocardioides sp.]|uniref:hypothetical protein n=1 Tax=Nocardioides sp. TaxID=35761 RepID=UPI000C90510F|nr:hypothetical protein [Pimelobacter sp.]